MSSELQPDTAAAIQFRHHAFPDGPIHLMSLFDGTPPDAATFDVGEDEAMARWLDERQGERNIYFHVNELKATTRNRKAKKEDVEAASYLHVDIDDVSARSRIEAFDPPPTFTVFSGGGFQLFWRLTHPSTDLDGVEARNRRIAEELGGDNCHNIDRIMRLPGTINVLSPKKQAAGRKPAIAHIVGELTDWSRSYPLQVFPRSTSAPDGHEEVSATGAIPSHVELDHLPPGVTDFTRDLIRCGDDRHAPRSSERPRFRSRSEAVFRVTCDLVRAGCAPEVIASLLLDPAYGISESVRQKQTPKKYALRQVKAAMDAVGAAWPDVWKSGSPRPTYRNTVLGLRRMGFVGEYDQFHRRKTVAGFAIQQYQGDLSDDLTALLRAAFIESHQFDPGKNNLVEGANYLCLENSVHPIREYLNGLAWDGVPRVTGWLSKYLSADATPLNESIGTILLVAAVRRIRSPGVKFDHIVVLEGTQGTGKSTAVRILAGNNNFSDQDLLTLDAKQQMEAMEGVWLYEISELSGLNRSETNRVKAFVSRQVDQGRPAYGRFREDRPRQTVFIGTTNEDTYLRDMTGNRRFWPVATGVIDLAALDRDRDQLWAEAAVLEAQGYSLTLPEHLWPAAEVEQLARLEEHPWFEKLSQVQGAVSGRKERISTEDIFTYHLSIALEHRAQHHHKQLAALMRQLGWTGPKKFHLGDKTPRGYERDSEEADRPAPRPPY